jgi:hypothetical protein
LPKTSLKVSFGIVIMYLGKSIHLDSIQRKRLFEEWTPSGLRYIPTAEAQRKRSGIRRKLDKGDDKIANAIYAIATAIRGRSGSEQSSRPILTVRVSNSLTERVVDLHADISNEVKLYDVIYESEIIKKANIRKMRSEDRIRLGLASKELVFEVYDSTKANNNVFLTFTKGTIKRTSTSDLYRAIPKKDKNQPAEGFNPVHIRYAIKDNIEVRSDEEDI